MKSKIDKEIIYLAIPNIISNVSVPLLSTVDTSLMGNLTADHLGAVGLSSMLFNFIYWNFGFLRMGTTGMTAQAFGKRDHNNQSAVLSRGITLAIILAILIFALQNILFATGSQLLNIIPNQESLVLEYFSIRIWEAPATLLLYVLFGWLFGMQNSIYPMIITICINIVNIVISYISVRHFGMEIRGVAMGTVIAQYTGVILALGFIYWKFRSHLQCLSFTHLRPLSSLVDFMKINSNLFIRTVCLTGAFGFFYAKSSIAGPLALAGNIVLQQFLNWMSYAIDGFAYAAESLTGKYFGAEEESNTKTVISKSMLWGVVLSVGFSLVFYVFGNDLAKIFSEDVAVLSAIDKYLPWMVAIPIAAFASYIWDGVYIGLTATRSLMISMIISLAIYVTGYLIALEWLEPNTALWLSLTIFLLARGVVQSLYYRHYGLSLK